MQDVGAEKQRHGRLRAPVAREGRLDHQEGERDRERKQPERHRRARTGEPRCPQLGGSQGKGRLTRPPEGEGQDHAEANPREQAEPPDRAELGARAPRE